MSDMETCSIAVITKRLRVQPESAQPQSKCCDSCVWVDHFTPREDEKRRMLVLGCKKPGWEGYTWTHRMACGGVFYYPARQEVKP